MIFFRRLFEIRPLFVTMLQIAVRGIVLAAGLGLNAALCLVCPAAWPSKPARAALVKAYLADNPDQTAASATH
jgi:hypothetical protein